MKLPCQSGAADRFFPASNAPAHQIDPVKAECRPCPIRKKCLNWALLHGEAGIWGGTTENGRKRIRYRRHIKVQPLHVTILDDDRDEIVRGMVARGMNGPQIAAALNISHSGAWQAMQRVKRHAS
jgi:hypothetical protein